MPQRRFLIAPPLAPLLSKEHAGAAQVSEGSFPAHPHRDQFVSLEPRHCYLVLTTTKEGAEAVERTELPRSQAEALLAVCAGEVTFECSILRLRGSKQALLRRFFAPEALDLVSVAFEDSKDANAFAPPAWLGPEVTQNAAYRRGTLARIGLLAPVEVPLSNAMLTELLDTLEEGALAMQLSHTGPLGQPEGHGVDKPVQAAPFGANPLAATPVDPARRDALMAGLAEALETLANSAAPCHSSSFCRAPTSPDPRPPMRITRTSGR